MIRRDFHLCNTLIDEEVDELARTVRYQASLPSLPIPPNLHSFLVQAASPEQFALVC